MADEPESPRAESPAEPPAVPQDIPWARPLIRAENRVSEPPHAEFLLLNSTRASAWVDLGLVLFSVIALDIGAGLVLALITGVAGLPEEIPDSAVERILLLPGLAIRMAGVIAIIAWILRRRRQSAQSVGFARRGLALNCLIGLGAMGTAYVFIWIWQVTLWLAWPELLDQLATNTDRLLDLVPRQSPFGFVRLALLIGIYEELLFRGFLMTRLRRATGSWAVAVLLSTAVFASLHLLDQETIILVPISILSLIFSMVTIWRRSLVPAIVGHWLFNLTQFLGLYYLAGDSWA